MKAFRILKTNLFGGVYGLNLLLALALWLCGNSGNIMLGIIFIVFYRLSLWLAPVAVTVICWLPSRPPVSVDKKLLVNLCQFFGCGLLFVVSYLLFGNWY